MSRIRFTRRFQRNLDDILSYITQDSPVNARRVTQDIRDSIGILEDFPSVGRNGSVEGTRELVMVRSPYIVIYRFLVDIDEVQVLDVVHGARDRN